MRIIADENVSGTVIARRRALGHDVVSVKEQMRGASDEEVLLRAQAERRLVITHDKDFGELAFRFHLPSECRIVLFRLSGAAPEADNQRVVEVLESRRDWARRFAVVDDRKMRVRLLPRAPSSEGDWG